MNDTLKEIFNDDFFKSLSSLKLAIHLRLDKGMNGGRKSSTKGASVEFSDFREYIPGDDVRRIDWNVYGRMDKLYIKQFMEEKEATYHIFLDNSKSMDFPQSMDMGNVEKKKSTMALRLCGAFSYMILGQLDRVVLHTTAIEKNSEENLKRSGIPITGRVSIQRILKDLGQVVFNGNTNLESSIKKCNIRGKGVSIIISDFLDPYGVEGVIKYLTFKRQEIVLIQVLAREEVDFYGEGTVSLIDSETRDEMKITMTRQSIGLYEKQLKAHKENLNRFARKYGCVYQCVIADEPIHKVILEGFKHTGFLLGK